MNYIPPAFLKNKNTLKDYIQYEFLEKLNLSNEYRLIINPILKGNIESKSLLLKHIPSKKMFFITSDSFSEESNEILKNIIDLKENRNLLLKKRINSNNDNNDDNSIESNSSKELLLRCIPDNLIFKNYIPKVSINKDIYYLLNLPEIQNQILFNTLMINKMLPLNVLLNKKVLRKIRISKIKFSSLLKESFLEQYLINGTQKKKQEVITLTSLYDIKSLLDYSFSQVILLHHKDTEELLGYVLLRKPKINNSNRKLIKVSGTSLSSFSLKKSIMISNIVLKTDIVLFGLLEKLKDYIRKEIILNNNLKYNSNPYEYIFSLYRIDKHGNLLDIKSNLEYLNLIEQETLVYNQFTNWYYLGYQLFQYF